MASTTSSLQTPSPLDPHRRRRPRRGRVLRFIGKTCLTVAFILAAYIAWLLWGTGIYTAGRQDGLREQLQSRIEEDRPHPGEPTILPGRAYAVLQIPSIDLDVVIVEGTDVTDLKSGPGHYRGTADPWDPGGRVAIAGHRTTYGAPFWDLDRIRTDDPIRLITELGTFEYRVTGSREVVPTATGVLRPSRGPSLVLTTCSPKFSAARRLIVFADRVGEPA